MISLGFMTLDLQSEDPYITEIAKHSGEYEIHCFRFVPSNIDPLTEDIDGERFDPYKKKWIANHFPIPKILYDRCFYHEDSHSRQCKAIVNWLKTRKDIQFLSFGFPDQFDLSQTLSKSQLAPYLPKTVFSQPNLYLKDKHGRPLFVRSLLQKDEKGEWKIIKKMGMRQITDKMKGSSTDGTIKSISSLLTHVPRNRRNYVNNEINHILLNLPPILEESFKRLFELEVDIGIKEDYSLWILNVNSKPEHKIILNKSNPDLRKHLYEAPLKLAKTLIR